MGLHFETVTEKNRREVLRLALLPEQNGYIEPVRDCLKEAGQDQRWQPVGIYDGGTLVGFAMYGFFLEEYPPSGRLWLDRFLIDAAYQGNGLGKAALTELLAFLAIKYPEEDIYLSVVAANKPAIQLYISFGFRFNGEKDICNEDIMVRKYRSYHCINMDAYPRRSHFDYFKGLAYPYVGLTANVEITDFLSVIKAEQLPFFLTFNYCVAKSMNRIPEFRQRILDGVIIEYDHCRTSHTVALEDGTYCYCTLDCGMAFKEYLPYALQAHQLSKQEKRTNDEGDVNELIFISTLPWLTYTGLIQPTPIPADSNPRVTWGAYFKQASKIFIPVSVLCNHALVDGLHISQFYNSLNQNLSELVDLAVG